MLIHWIKDKQKQRPTTVAELISKLQAGEIDENSLAWHQGCSSWVALKELPALQSFFRENIPCDAPPPKDESESAPTATPEPSPEQSSKEPTIIIDEKSLQEKMLEQQLLVLKMPSPFQRFLARMLDLCLYGFIYMLIINWREIPYSQGLELSNPFIWLPFIPLEAAIISYFRTTPGKALLGIKLYSIKGRDGMNFAVCLKRSFLVYALGVGMMLVMSPIPLFLIALALSYRKLKNQGYTSWDERCQTVLLQRDKPHPFKPFLAGFMVCYLFTTTLGLMEPWLPAMFEQIAEQSPEAAQQLDEIKKMMPLDIQKSWPTQPPQKD